jgi:hypothetical protein
VNDVAFGYVILGIGILVVLGVVFAISIRQGGGPARERPKPPRGVHLPPGSYLPVLLAVGAALLGAGLAFRSTEELANPFLAIPGLLVLVVSIVGWVRAANREWRETERGAHHDDETAEAH